LGILLTVRRMVQGIRVAINRQAGTTPLPAKTAIRQP
jgi:hypothetical protein